MGNIFKRIKNRCSMTARNLLNDLHFSPGLAGLRFVCDIGGRLGLKKISRNASERKDAWILGYLRELLAPIIAKYQNTDGNGIYDRNAPIWVCWWTGKETAPLLVQKCIKSIEKNAGGRPVVLITEENCHEYCTVPDQIFEKMKSGRMGLAHFADYLRVSLLEKYGGLWLDATIYCSNIVPEMCFDLPFFTCKSEVKKGYYLSDYQWVTFCLGGHKGHIFYRFMKAAFEQYWSKNDTAVDYLFFDYLIYIAKECVPGIKNAMDNVPINNVHRDDLQAAMNAALPAEKFNDIICEDTVLYKLSWREEYVEILPDGRKSIYGGFIE